MEEKVVVERTVYVQEVEKKSNGVGLGGFVVSLVGLFTFWIPILGWIIWLVGAVLSAIGVFKAPRGFAIAGLIISFIAVILLILAVCGLMTALAVGGKM